MSRTRSRRRPHRPKRNWLLQMALAVFSVVLAILVWAALARHFAPSSNTALTRFDAIIVLGHPADSDGNPTPLQLSVVTEAVQEYERGVAPRLILTGGAVANQYVEARVMARIAEAQGVPASAVFVEPRARDTIQNACYAVHILRNHGWRSAEVVSNPSQLPRVGLILSHLPLEWRTHAAPLFAPESVFEHDSAAALETLKTARYLLYARRTENCQP